MKDLIFYPVNLRYLSYERKQTKTKVFVYKTKQMVGIFTRLEM